MNARTTIEQRRAAVEAAAQRRGARSYRSVRELAEEAGVTERTIRRDRRRLGATQSPARCAERQSRVWRMAVALGLSTDEIARVTGRSRKTIERDKRALGCVAAARAARAARKNAPV